MVMTTTNKLPIGPTNPDGKLYGNSPTDLVGFWGNTPIVQPTNPMQTAIPVGASGIGNAGGAATIYASSQSPVGVVANTTAEQSLTVTGVLATDLVFMNKPTSQAGLGHHLPRASAANTVKGVFGNATGSTITPTASETYIVQTLAANLQVTPTLSPSPVVANSVSEQQFTLAGASLGLAPGMVLWANKPTTQAGLALTHARVVSNNVVALSFINYTASTITPTASEVYLLAGLNALTPVQNLLNFGINFGTVAGIATITTAERQITEAGLAATDLVVGISKPTLSAGVGVCSGRISAATALQVTYVNPTVTTVTPTASEVYAVTVYRPSPGALLSVFTVTITPASVAANTAAEQTFAVTGITSGQPVYGCPQYNFGTAGAVAPAGIRASATNQVAINFVNVSAAAIVPPAGSWVIAQFNQTTPTAGNNVSLSVLPLTNQMANLLGAIQSAAVTMGLIKGS